MNSFDNATEQTYRVEARYHVDWLDVDIHGRDTVTKHHGVMGTVKAASKASAEEQARNAIAMQHPFCFELVIDYLDVWEEPVTA